LIALWRKEFLIVVFFSDSRLHTSVHGPTLPGQEDPCGQAIFDLKFLCINPEQRSLHRIGYYGMRRWSQAD